MAGYTSVEDIDEAIAIVDDMIENAKGTTCEVYARIVGYYRAVSNWNKGKKEEFKKRKLFVEEKA